MLLAISYFWVGYMYYRWLTNKILLKREALSFVQFEKKSSTVLCFLPSWQKINIQHVKCNEFCKMLFSLLCSRFSEERWKYRWHPACWCHLVLKELPRHTCNCSWPFLSLKHCVCKGVEGKRRDLLGNLLFCYYIEVPLDVKNYNTVLWFTTSSCRQKQILVSP